MTVSLPFPWSWLVAGPYASPPRLPCSTSVTVVRPRQYRCSPAKPVSDEPFAPPPLTRPGLAQDTDRRVAERLDLERQRPGTLGSENSRQDTAVLLLGGPMTREFSFLRPLRRPG